MSERPVFLAGNYTTREFTAREWRDFVQFTLIDHIDPNALDGKSDWDVMLASCKSSDIAQDEIAKMRTDLGLDV